MVHPVPEPPKHPEPTIPRSTTGASSGSGIAALPTLTVHPKFEPPMQGLELSPGSASGMGDLLFLTWQPSLEPPGHGMPMTPAEEREKKKVRAKVKSWVKRMIAWNDGGMYVGEWVIGVWGWFVVLLFELLNCACLYIDVENECCDVAMIFVVDIQSLLYTILISSRSPFQAALYMCIDVEIGLLLLIEDSSCSSYVIFYLKGLDITIFRMRKVRCSLT
jgi:hypothetical protein